MTFDWDKALRFGMASAGDFVRSGTAITDEVIVWTLLIHATKVSKVYPSPPRSDYPSKSAMPDSQDEISFWHKMAAFVRGELDEAPAVSWQRPMPSAEDITRADEVLEVWHKAVSLGIHKKKALYLRACGVKTDMIRSATGLSAQEIKTAKRRACKEMIAHIKRYS